MSSRPNSMDNNGDNEEKVGSSEKPFRFQQWFKKMPTDMGGGEINPEADCLSAVEFDTTGDFVCTADKGGRCVILRADPSKANKIHFKFHCEFQSHEPEFDYVRSQAIDERINKVKWCPPSCGAQFMLTTNDRAIKLWKIHEKDIKFATGFNVTNDKGELKSTRRVRKLNLPYTEVVESLVTATPKRHYSAELHKFNIHSLCVMNDGESFLSADNLSVNLWNMEETEISYQIVNIKPVDMQQLTEVITAAENDQTNSHSFMYATNRGMVKLADLREKAICDYPGRAFSDPAVEEMEKKMAALTANGPADGGFGGGGANGNQPFIQEMLRSISDVKFSQNGKYIVARDYLTIKIWDVAMEKKPVEIIPVHDYLSRRVVEMYEKEYIFDCFDLAVNPRGDIITGSYNNFFHIYDHQHKNDTLIEASKAPITTCPITYTTDPANTLNESPAKSVKKKRMSRPGLVSLLGRKKKTKDGKSSSSLNNHNSNSSNAENTGVFADIDTQNVNFDKRILQLAWHPDCNAIAVAGENNLFIYAR